MDSSDSKAAEAGSTQAGTIQQGVSLPAAPTIPPASTPTASPGFPSMAATTPAQVPLREDQIQNAVAFLSHPKVKGSPQASKRSFLERKGLTEEEIAEAFRRVPDTPATTVAPETVTYLPQTQQAPAAQLPTASTAMVPALPQQQQVQPYQPRNVMVPAPPAAPQPQPVRWTQVVLGVGVVAAGVYGIMQLVVPRVRDAYSQWTEAARSRREEAARQQQELQASIVALRDFQDQLRTSSQGLAEAARALKEQLEHSEPSRAAIRYSDTDTEAEALRRELQALKAAVRRSATPPAASASRSTLDTAYDNPVYTYPDGSRYSGSGMMPFANGGTSNVGVSYSAMHQAGHSSGHSPGAHTPSYGMESPRQVDSYPAGSRSAPAQPSGAAPKYPPSFQEVMDMVSKGITPPNVRTDINDLPPNPDQPLSEARMQPRPKPWEARAQNTMGATSNGPSYSAASYPPQVAAPSPMTAWNGPSAGRPFPADQFSNGPTHSGATFIAQSGPASMPMTQPAAADSTPYGTPYASPASTLTDSPTMHASSAAVAVPAAPAPTTAEPSSEPPRGSSLSVSAAPFVPAFANPPMTHASSAPAGLTATSTAFPMHEQGHNMAPLFAQDAGISGAHVAPVATNFSVPGVPASNAEPASDVAVNIAPPPPPPPPVSVLQPLVSAAAGWKPPAPPQPSLPRVRSAGSVASAASNDTGVSSATAP